MLKKYGNYIYLLKKFKRKVDTWKLIAVDTEKDFDVKFTHLLIKNHYKTVGKRKKEVIGNHRSSGAASIEDPHEEEWNQITNTDNSVVDTIINSMYILSRYMFKS